MVPNLVAIFLPILVPSGTTFGSYLSANIGSTKSSGTKFGPVVQHLVAIFLPILVLQRAVKFGSYLSANIGSTKSSGTKFGSYLSADIGSPVVPNLVAI